MIATKPKYFMDDKRPHIPVMLEQVCGALLLDAGSTVVDATFGAGGYTRAFLETGATVIAIDRDPAAISEGDQLVVESEGRLLLQHGRFSNLDAIAAACGFDKVDAVVADVGVSSMQIDQARRGFSFQQDGPLDMRMEGAGLSAADVVNTFERKDLTRIIGILGEEKKASRISAQIVEQRQNHPFNTTLELARTVEKVLGRRPTDRIHPATRTFQALRIFVNRELHELAEALLAAERVLKPGGRLAIVSFHSLEDRLVKRFFADRAESRQGSRHLPVSNDKSLTFTMQKRGATGASREEAEANVRARSAKLRWGIRTDAAPRAADLSIFNLPNLPEGNTDFFPRGNG